MRLAPVFSLQLKDSIEGWFISAVATPSIVQNLDTHAEFAEARQKNHISLIIIEIDECIDDKHMWNILWI